MKRTTSRAREFVPCWSAHHGPARTRAKSQTPGRLKHIEEFPDGVLTLVLIRRSDGRAGTRLEMVFQQQRIDLLQRTLDGHGLFDDIDAVGPILDHPGHAPHVSLDAAQADGGLGPNVRGAMLEVDLGHRHTAPPPTLPPPLWGGVRPIIASPRGFRIAILPGDASYRETPITCTSRAATVPSPLACPTITTRSFGLQRRPGRPEAVEPRRRADDDDAGLAGVEDNNQIRSARHHDSAAVDVASLHRHPAYRRRIAITGLRGQHQASRGNQYNRDSDKMCSHRCHLHR